MSSEPSGAERRVHERKPLHSMAHLLLSNHPPFAVRTLDISASGLGIVARADPPIGVVCGLRVEIPDKAGAGVTHEVQARVIHSVFSRPDEGYKVGLQFVTLSPPLAMAIIQFLKN